METNRKNSSVGDLKAVTDRIRERRDAGAHDNWYRECWEDIGTLLAIVEKAGEMREALTVVGDFAALADAAAAFDAAVQDAVKGASQ